MNAPHKLLLVSHPPCVSRYGTHTSLCTAERVEIIDALTQTLGATLNILARLKHSQQTLRTVSFLPVQTLLRRLLNANTRYADFLVTGITDLGGHAQRDALYRLNDAAEPLCFADCLKGIDRSIRRLGAADALFRDCRASAIANNDYASRQLFEACIRHNGYFLSLINNHLFAEH
ncbi:hypothetical protein [Pseudomonas sp. IAC-BECa141]|uniref:hypothetical protein n=1 Tax=Pseudomonas sp. IAC-BECa141 TaxID=2793103 RepID=UPI001D09088C|nr:hypothetical protein [Pseudomonas sp. IAC-BECa141]UDI95266.1 hypothetical protein I5961_12430 [Pseudomonas sp. IAC-BECa141]